MRGSPGLSRALTCLGSKRWSLVCLGDETERSTGLTPGDSMSVFFYKELMILFRDLKEV